MTTTTPQARAIRKRTSYRMFLRILTAFKKSNKKGLEQIHMELNKKSAYGTYALSMYARESLNQLLKDNEL